MKESQDFREFIELLNKHEVCYLMVGGYALSYHSRPKFTQAIDFWIDKNKENAKKVLRVLEDFGFGGLGISIADLTTSGKIIQLGVEPLRIDLLTSVDGLQFENAYKEKVQGHYYDVPVDIISLDDLIRNKKASSRKKDQQDLEWIEQYRPD